MDTIKPKKLYKYKNKSYRDFTPEQKKNSNACAYLKSYVKRGVVQKLPCEVCGDPKSEGHHEDYNYPLFVIWLCHKHHMQMHRGPDLISMEDYQILYKKARRRFLDLVRTRLYKPGRRLPKSISHFTPAYLQKILDGKVKV